TVGYVTGTTAVFVTGDGNSISSGNCAKFDSDHNLADAGAPCGTGSGSVTSVGLSVPAGSIFGVTGSPVTSSGSLGLTTTGVSGGVPYFSSISKVESSDILAENQIMVGGGEGMPPKTISGGTSSTVLHGGNPHTFDSVDLSTDVTGTLPVANGGSGGLTSGIQGGLVYFSSTSSMASTSAFTALVLNNGSAGPGAYGGASCTNQVPTAQSAVGGWSCSSVSNAMLTNSSITLNAGSNVGITAPGAMTLGSTYTIGSTSDTPRFAGLGLGGAAAGANSLKIYGSSSGSITFAIPAAAGSNTITFPAGTTDFSATGGTSQVVKQTSTGSALTVARLACSDLSDSASGCSTATPTVKGVAGIGWIAGSNPDKSIVFTAAQSMTITDIRGTVDTAVGATATVSLYKTASGTACSSGTNLIDSAGTFNANGTAVTNQNLTLAGSGAPSMSAGDRVCLSTGNGANFASGSGIGGITITYTVP
ncbi:MAG TPA: hypothetical protein VJQ25_07220, partial [Nitrospira sp.]|nr:hypothetical protein [Nitrospira sp.]